MVDVIQIRPHLAAQPAVGDGVVGVAVESHGAAVDDLGDEAAGVGAVVGAGTADVGDVCGRDGVDCRGWVEHDTDLFRWRVGGAIRGGLSWRMGAASIFADASPPDRIHAYRLFLSFWLVLFLVPGSVRNDAWEYI